LAVLANGLADGQDVVFVEAALGAGAPVPGGAEAHQLGRVFGVGAHVGVGVQQARNVGEDFFGGGLARQGMNSHYSRLLNGLCGGFNA